MNNKKGWIRIIEAVAAILVIISAVIVFVSNAPNKPDVSENMKGLEKAILTDISLNNEMRILIINTPETLDAAYLDSLRDFVRERMPVGMKNNSAVCVTNPEYICKPTNYDKIADKQLFVDDRLIFMNDITKRVMLFIWLK